MRTTRRPAALVAVSAGLLATHVVIGVARGAVFYVDAAASGSETGGGWCDAFRSLQGALMVASSGDEIRLAGGIYRPSSHNDRNASFDLVSGVSIFGGFAGCGASNPDYRNPLLFETVLSGDLGVQGDPSDNSYHVIRAAGVSPATVLDGLTISSGNANLLAAPDNSGGGLRLTGGASPTLRDCIIELNNASGNGGGVYCDPLCNPRFERCQIRDNVAPVGGGLFAVNAMPHIVDTDFISNSAGSQGGGASLLLSTVEIANCRFLANSGSLFGGGLHMLSCGGFVTECEFRQNSVLNASGASLDGGGGAYIDNCSITLSRSIFLANWTSDDGGGLFVKIGSALITGCRFLGNAASENGGGVATQGRGGLIINCEFSGNSAVNLGGGLWESGGAPRVTNCTFSRNSASFAGGGLYFSSASPLVENSILWTNSVGVNTGEPGQVNGAGGTATFNHCCVAGWSGAYAGFGNISSGPRFINSLGPDGVAGTLDDDLHLRIDSPCIDTGLIVPGLAGSVDLDGQPRILGCGPDIGADEYPLGPPNSGDFDGNGIVNGADLQHFVRALLIPLSPIRCVADINADLIVDAWDALAFQSLLLGAPPVSQDLQLRPGPLAAPGGGR